MLDNYKMFAITSNTMFGFSDRFKKIGKKLQKQRQGDVERIKDKLSDIAREEERRAKDIFKQHRDVFKKTKKSSSTPKSIDLYEK
tara:strand:- start:12 stop:266 length:255 start_codon:yes stop_codon:yes gene_type:complete